MNECSERVSDLSEVTQQGNGRGRLELELAGFRPTRPQFLEPVAVAAVDKHSLKCSLRPPILCCLF